MATIEQYFRRIAELEAEVAALHGRIDAVRRAIERLWTSDGSITVRDAMGLIRLLDPAVPAKGEVTRVPDGTPGVRDPDAPCKQYAPGEPEIHATCQGDGHHLCAECTERDAGTLDEGEDDGTAR